MLSFFRRLINSRVGLIVTFLFLGVIALAFAAGDVTNLSTGTGGLTGNDVARIGDAQVTAAELRTRAQDELQAARQQQPTLDMPAFLAAGGLDGTFQRLVTGAALAEFGRDQGMLVSKRAVDGQIASIPGLQGPTGRFDESLFRRILAQRQLTEEQVRADIQRDTLVQQLIFPTQGASQLPRRIALPYASLLLERRAGLIGFVPAAAVPVGPAPTDAELTAFYGRNLRRYGVPERRAIRYALVTPELVRARATPTEAEIAQAYQRNAAQYRPTERRTIAQVIVADQAGATALAARVRGGASLADAARAAGLEASTRTNVDKATYARENPAALADQLFAAERGAVVGPVRGPLGFVVARVEGIEQVPGRTLDQVRGEITAALTRTKTTEALARVQESLDDALGDDATFDELVADQRLQPRTTPPLTAAGVDPDSPGQADPALRPLVTAAFQAEEGDEPQLVQLGPDGGFAVVAVGQVVPAAPRPLAQIRDRVAADLVADRRRQAARRIAGEVLARVNRGAPLAQALSAAGASLPAPRPISAFRRQLAESQGGADPALALLFSMPQGAARLLEAPAGAGWQIVKLDRIERGDARREPAAVAAATSGLSRLTGRELAEQFARAARAAVGVRVDDTALARVRADLSGQGGSDN